MLEGYINIMLKPIFINHKCTVLLLTLLMSTQDITGRGLFEKQKEPQL